MALLSYPVPMLPVIQLLTSQRTEPALPVQASTFTPAVRDSIVRLSLLLLSTLIALLIPDFGRIASILGCVNLAGCQVTCHTPDAPVV